MKSPWIVRIVFALGALLILSVIVLGQTASKSEQATFSQKDREAVEAYYKHLHGVLAPASIERKPLSPETEKALVPGKKIPQFEKQLQKLPRELELKLSTPQPGFDYYVLGSHVLLVRRSDLLIGDIIRNAGWK
jgi:hypothetical protein